MRRVPRFFSLAAVRRASALPDVVRRPHPLSAVRLVGLRRGILLVLRKSYRAEVAGQ